MSPVKNPGLQEQVVGEKDEATVSSMIAIGEGWELKSESPEAGVMSLPLVIAWGCVENISSPVSIQQNMRDVWKEETS